jgi:hypothetical protein
MPVTLVEEDGTGKADANSYLNAAEADTLMENSPATEVWEDADSDDKKTYLIAAATYLDRAFRFYGLPYTNTQALAWPRTRNEDNRGRTIPAGTIPTQLKAAQLEIASAFTKDPTLLQEVGLLPTPKGVTTGGNIKGFSVDGLSFTVGGNATRPSTRDVPESTSPALLGYRFPSVELLLRSIGTFNDIAFLQGDRTTTP